VKPGAGGFRKSFRWSFLGEWFVPKCSLRKGGLAPTLSPIGCKLLGMPGESSSRLTRVAELFGSLAAAAIEEKGGTFSIGYREGRDVCIIARGKTWD